MLEDYNRSQAAYTRATEIDPYNPLAWKGLIVLSEHRKFVPSYLDAVAGLILCYQKADSMVDAVEALETARKFVRKNTTDVNEAAYLRLQLPGSPIFEYMEGRLPQPPATYGKLIKLEEASESKLLSKHKGKGVSRISSKSNTNDDIYTIYKKSKLPALYDGVLSWSNDEEERREYEGKLLAHTYETLKYAPATEKASLVSKIRDMASGAVLLKSTDVLAWKIEIEWADVEDFKDYDQALLVTFVEKFPDEPLAKVLTGFLSSEISPFANSSTIKLNEKNHKEEARSEEGHEGEVLEDEEDLEEIEAVTELSPELILEYLTDGFSQDSNSLLAYRILGAYHIRLREYETACDIGLKGLDLTKSFRNKFGSIFPNSINHLESIVGTAYVFYQAPKNFNLALQLFANVLKKNPDYTAAKIGRGLILREKSKYSEAKDLLKSALDQEPDNAVILYEYAWCQVLQGEVEEGRAGLSAALEKFTGSDLLSHDYRSQTWWRIGQSYWLHAQEADTNVMFNAFASSLRENPNYAPTYTSLGKVYSQLLKDVVRATKCFYKAFEIDGGEIEAAEHLVTEFADSMQWDLVEVVATRVIESERVRSSSGREPSWPYRVLGIASLNSRDFQKAVKCFQAAIRLSPEDPNSWVGLGEAYTNSGRYVAAAKTFERAKLLDPQNWFASYHLGIVQRYTQDYGEAIRTFQQVSALNPDEKGVKFALFETLLMSAKNELKKEAFGQAALLAEACIKYAGKNIHSGLDVTQDLWKVLSECCEVFLTVQSKLSSLPVDTLADILHSNAHVLQENEDMKHISEIDGIEVDSLLANLESSEESSRNPVDFLSHFYISFLKLSFFYARKDKSTRAIAWYNLGLGELQTFLKQDNKDDTTCLHASVDCLKRVIRLQNNNADFWNAYGVACSYLNVKVAQHCFIRSVSLDSKQPSSWNNLAALYLQKGDMQLSEASIGRSLIIDPDFVPSWIGQGIISQTLGNAADAHKSFEHSFKISKGMSKLSKLYYALSVFEQLQESRNETALTEKLESSVLSLQKYLALTPDSPIALMLQGLLLERVSSYEYATEHVTKLCAIYEQQYEESESQASFIKFVKTKAHLARVCLGAKQYEIAVEHGEFACDVSSDTVDQDEEIAEEIKKSRLSAFLTCGLAYYFLNEYGSSIKCFKSALIESNEDPDVIVLLAQVLWAHGGSNEKDVALEQLFGTIEKLGSATPKLALTLGAIGIVHDNELIEAAEDELVSFSEPQLQKDDPYNHVPQMLSAMNNARGTDIRGPWYRSAFYNPWEYDVWRHIDSNIALELAKTGQAVSTTELSNAYVTAGLNEKTALRAVFFAPWNDNAWAGLAETLT